MLAMKRKAGQAVTITPPGQNDIVVTVTKVNRSDVSLSIVADAAVRIVRDDAVNLEVKERN